MRLGALCLVGVAAALAVTAEPAHACSCAVVDAREALVRADAAFVGTLVERRDERDGVVTMVFRVEERFKGLLGTTVDVRTASNGAACGIEAPIGSRVGLFLDRENGRWVGSLCGQVEPARLRDAAGPLPAPNGKGPVALLVGGRFGPARMLALDRNGRTLAYGHGAGSVIAMSSCPGGTRVAEAAQTQAGVELAVRELRTLRVVRRQRLEQPAGTYPTALRCVTTSGDEVVVFTSSSDFPQRAHLTRVTGTRASVLWRGTALSASLTDRLAYVNAGRRATMLLAVDLRTRAVKRLGRTPAFTGPLLPNAGGTLLAGLAVAESSQAVPSRVVLAAPGRRPWIRTAPLAAPSVSGDVFWLRRSRLVFFPRHGTDSVRVFDLGLHLVSRRQGWQVQMTALVDATAFGVTFPDGRLLRMKLPAGPVRTARRLPSPVSTLVVAVD